MTISQLAKNAGVTAETVRYYQKIGLLKTPARPHHGFRSYGEEDALHLRFIRHGQLLGFSLDEIATLLQLSTTDCKRAELIAQERLFSVRDKIAALHRLENALQRIVSECARRQPYAACPLIETLLADSS